ncbi:hypothetical protein JZO67_005230 [Enterococcus sp. 665A]|uniref:CAAX prenyl protease 2/Lysostaphin resistance protein A-like domain-containing protein n=2 Tax=Candidatus Enterococcus ferrettii TaxID=2815324 RepID=A0ABV0EXI0_9ENTE
MKLNNMLRYLTLTFAISWSCWLLVVFLIKTAGIELFSPIGLSLYSLGAASPMFSAWIVQRKYASKEEYHQFKHGIANIKQPISAYLLVGFLAWAFCFFPVLLGTSKQVAPVYVALQQLPIMIFFGGGLEEVGWRGYLLPEMQKKYSRFISTCFVAAIWLCWHLPLWLVTGSGQDRMNFLVFALWVFSLALLLTLIWNKYQSTLLCILLHAGFNSFSNVYPPDFNQVSVSGLLFLLCLGIYFLHDYLISKKVS